MEQIRIQDSGSGIRDGKILIRNKNPGSATLSLSVLIGNSARVSLMQPE